ncbi:MAG: hypothetical protein EPO21_12050 [Chloroflexota bacterium]|nr:MAG: hypothetical protein EPO21_12050 [Chloroflexota bacterium]
MKINLQKQHAGDLVPRGTYLNTKTWDLVAIDEDGEQLPGPWQSSYVKVPVLTVLLAGPIVGLLFVILLPMLAPIALAAALVSRIRPHSRIANWIAMPMAAPAQPGLAFLQPEPQAPVAEHKPSEQGDSEIDVLLTELEREIDQRRRGGKS